MLEDCERLALQFPRAHGIHVVTYIQPSVQNVHFSLNNGWNDKFNQNTGWSIFQLTNMFNIYETFPQRNRDKVQSCSCRTLKYITTDGQILAHACHKDFSNRDDRERESRSGRFAIGQVILPEACTTYTDGKKKKKLQGQYFLFVRQPWALSSWEKQRHRPFVLMPKMCVHTTLPRTQMALWKMSVWSGWDQRQS